MVCMICDHTDFTFFFIDFFLLWIKRRQKKNHIGKLRAFCWLSRIKPKWPSYVRYNLPGLLNKMYCWCTLSFERKGMGGYFLLIIIKQAKFSLFSRNSQHIYGGVGSTHRLIVGTLLLTTTLLDSFDMSILVHNIIINTKQLSMNILFV